MDDITSSFKDEGVSILVEKEQYNQGEIPVIIVSNDGETSVSYQAQGFYGNISKMTVRKR